MHYDIIFYRRKRLGWNSCKGVSQVLNEMGINSVVFRHDRIPPGAFCKTLIRWGCTAQWKGDDWGYQFVLNPSEGIHWVNDKMISRFYFENYSRESGDRIVPLTIRNIEEIEDDKQYIVRYEQHSRGRNAVIFDGHTLKDFFSDSINREYYYASEFIDKEKEYRVYVMNGKVVSVAEKIPEDRSAPLWNRATNDSEFKNVRWGNWPIHVVSVALKAMSFANAQSGLNFGGVDVIVDSEGKPYVLEINSAPSLPYFRGDISYRQECMAKAIAFEFNNYRDYVRYNNLNHDNGWKGYIHEGLFSDG